MGVFMRSADGELATEVHVLDPAQQ